MNHKTRICYTWTVSLDLWQTALIAVDVRLFHEARFRMVHTYRVYKDPFPHLAIRVGGGSDQQTLVAGGPGHGYCEIDTPPHIDTSIGSATRSGPGGWFHVCTAFTFASAITILGDDPDSEQSPERVPVDRPTIQIHNLVCPDIPEGDDMDVSIEVSDVPVAVHLPPPGFKPFSWLTAVGVVIHLCLTFRRSIILGFWSGLACRSLPVCWKWDRGCGRILYLWIKLWMQLSSCIRTSV